MLKMRWSVLADRLFIGFEELASAVRALTPTKRSIGSLLGRFTTPLLTWLRLLFRSKSSYMSSAKQRLTGTNPACQPDGLMEYTECKFEVCSTTVSNPTRVAPAVFKCSSQKVGVTMGVVNLLTPIGNPLVVLYLIATVQY